MTLKHFEHRMRKGIIHKDFEEVAKMCEILFEE